MPRQLSWIEQQPSKLWATGSNPVRGTKLNCPFSISEERVFCLWYDGQIGECIGDNQILINIILKNFKNPDEIRNFDKGKFELVRLADMTIGKASYKPGWKWSVDVSPLSGTEFCEVEHLGMVISGSATVAFKNGKIYTLKEGDLFLSLIHI